MIMQIDALQRNVEENISGAVKMLETIGAGAVGTIGTSLLLPHWNCISPGSFILRFCILFRKRTKEETWKVKNYLSKIIYSVWSYMFMLNQAKYHIKHYNWITNRVILDAEKKLRKL
jgi:hypothetical protein